MKPVSVRPLKTSLFSAGQDLLSFLREHLEGEVGEGDVVAITSKIVSLAEGRLLPRSEAASKHDLAAREADHYLGPGLHGSELTIKHGILIPSAGIDESNSEEGGYILYPLNPYASAERIGRFLRQCFGLNRLGVILTDSHSMPLRRGVTGISLAHWGLKGTRELAGQPDLFGRPLKFTHVDVVDALAAMAVFVMGEAADASPLAVISNARPEFTNSTSASEVSIQVEDDLYYPLIAPLLKGSP